VTAWHEEAIGKKHGRDVFGCSEQALNDFLRRYVRKSHELGGAKTFLAIDDPLLLPLRTVEAALNKVRKL
jgi:hypothetical protein